MNKTVLLIVCLLAFSMFSATAFAHHCPHGTVFVCVWKYHYLYCYCKPIQLPTCKTCLDYSGQCGTFDNGCGRTITCGCPEGQTCNNRICQIVQPEPTPEPPCNGELVPEPKSNFWEVHNRMMQALMPDKNHDCQINTYIPRPCKPGYEGDVECILPKRILTICWSWVTDEYKQDFMQNPFGEYEVEKEWTSLKWTFNWWKLI